MADTKGKLFTFLVTYRNNTVPTVVPLPDNTPPSTLVQASYVQVTDHGDYLLKGADHQTVFSAPKDVVLSVAREEDLLEDSE